MLYRLLSRLPLTLLYALAWPCYLLLYYLAGYRKAVVQQNLTHAFPDKSAREITVLAKKFYLQLVQVALEILKTRRMSAADVQRRVQVVNPELLREYSNGFDQPDISQPHFAGCFDLRSVHHGRGRSHQDRLALFQPGHGQETVGQKILQVSGQAL